MTLSTKSLLRLRLVGWELSLSLWWIILLLIFLPLLTNLGLWQLDRAAERKDALSKAEVVKNKDPIPVSHLEAPSINTTYIRVHAEGKMDWARQFLLDNQTHNTVEGFEVLTPMLLAEGSAILVSRGWLPKPPEGKPDLTVPHTISSETSLIGLAVIPAPRMADFQRENLMKSGNYKDIVDDPQLANWPVIIQEENFEKLSSLLELTLIPRVLHPEESKFNYRNIWKPAERGPTVHYGYAAQWFGMGVLLLGAALYLNLKRVD